MVLYGFLEISKFVIGVAKTTAVSFTFSCPVSNLFSNLKISFMVIYGYLEIFKVNIGVAKITIRFFFICLLSDFFGGYLVGVAKITVCPFLSLLSHFKFIIIC